MMKTRMMIIPSLLCLTIFFGQSLVAGDLPAVGDLTKPSEVAGERTATLAVFLRNSITAYRQADTELQQLEDRYKAADKAATDDATKRRLALDYLQSRERIISKMVEDFDFVNTRLAEQVGTINNLIGDMRTQRSLADRAAKASEDTRQIVNDIERLKRENRALQSQSPEMGTPAWQEWHNQNLQLRIEFRQAIGALRRSVQSAYVYNQLAQGIEMNQQETAQWQAYVSELSVIFAENKADLSAAQAMTAQYIELAKAGEVFDGLASFGEFAKEFGHIVGRVSEQPPVVVGPVRPGAPPPLPPLPALEDFDPVKFQKEYMQTLEGGRR